jgi:exodeoxyribonuclease VII small subunit
VPIAVKSILQECWAPRETRSRRGHRRPESMPSRSQEPATPDQASAASAEPIAFEAAVSELEAIVERMEAGTLSLEESLAAYRRGAELVARCRESLAVIQQQVRILEADLLKPLGGEGDDER